MDCDFIRVDFENVKNAYTFQIKERLNRVGNFLYKISEKNVEKIQTQMGQFGQMLELETDNMTQLKEYLNNLNHIKNFSIEMET